MESKRSRTLHWSDGEISSKEIDYELKRVKKKMKMEKAIDDDLTEFLIHKGGKKATKVAKKMKSSSVLACACKSNRFNDSKLDKKFVWRKKIERDVVRKIKSRNRPMNTNTNTNSHLPLKIMYSVKEEKRKERDRMEEIEKVKKRREEKAIEKAEREERMAFFAIERARAEFGEWEKKEEEFCFEQIKAGAEIRLREGRIKPIDIFSMHLDDPYLVFESLAVKDLEELRKDIRLYLELDRATPTRVRYWEALLVVCDWEVAEARKKEALNRARVRGQQPHVEEERGLHSSTEADVKNLLQGKSHRDLEELQTEIESQMRSGTAKVVEFWEAILKRINIYKAKACLKEYTAKMLRKHLEKDRRSSSCQEVDAGYDVKNVQPETEEAAEETGLYSPELFHGEETEEAIDPEEDMAILERKRVAALEEQHRRIQKALASRRVQSIEDKFDMEEGDALFDNNDEVSLDSQAYWWHDKYRLRKPKYFNRVQTEYEWNRYNRTHYDSDNPPPKIVKGYKFIIFYPDLLDRKVPTYTIEKDGDSAETCILRFHAGPPYEDIAFRIVNKGECSQKKGFKCTFERGCLQLNINFKHHSYRR